MQIQFLNLINKYKFLLLPLRRWQIVLIADRAQMGLRSNPCVDSCCG